MKAIIRGDSWRSANGEIIVPGTNDFPPDKPKPPAIPKKKKLHALFRLTFDDEGNCPSLDDVDGLGAFVDGVPDHSTAQYEDVVDAVKAVERRVTREMPGAGSKMIEAVSAVRALLEAQGMSLLKVAEPADASQAPPAGTKSTTSGITPKNKAPVAAAANGKHASSKDRPVGATLADKDKTEHPAFQRAAPVPGATPTDVKKIILQPRERNPPYRAPIPKINYPKADPSSSPGPPPSSPPGPRAPYTQADPIHSRSSSVSSLNDVDQLASSSPQRPLATANVVKRREKALRRDEVESQNPPVSVARRVAFAPTTTSPVPTPAPAAAPAPAPKPTQTTTQTPKPKPVSTRSIATAVALVASPAPVRAPARVPVAAPSPASVPVSTPVPALTSAPSSASVVVNVPAATRSSAPAPALALVRGPGPEALAPTDIAMLALPGARRDSSAELSDDEDEPIVATGVDGANDEDEEDDSDEDGDVNSAAYPGQFDAPLRDASDIMEFTYRSIADRDGLVEEFKLWLELFDSHFAPYEPMQTGDKVKRPTKAGQRATAQTRHIVKRMIQILCENTGLSPEVILGAVARGDSRKTRGEYKTTLFNRFLENDVPDFTIRRELDVLIGPGGAKTAEEHKIAYRNFKLAYDAPVRDVILGTAHSLYPQGAHPSPRALEASYTRYVNGIVGQAQKAAAFDGIHTLVICTATRPEGTHFQGEESIVFSTSALQNFTTFKFNTLPATVAQSAQVHVAEYLDNQHCTERQTANGRVQMRRTFTSSGQIAHSFQPDEHLRRLRLDEHFDRLRLHMDAQSKTLSIPPAVLAAAVPLDPTCDVEHEPAVPPPNNDDAMDADDADTVSTRPVRCTRPPVPDEMREEQTFCVSWHVDPVRRDRTRTIYGYYPSEENVEDDVQFPFRRQYSKADAIESIKNILKSRQIPYTARVFQFIIALDAIWEAGYTVANWPECVPLPREFKSGRKSYFESLRMPELAYLIAHLLAGGLMLIDRLPIPESQRKYISSATGQDATHFRIVTLPLRCADDHSRYSDQFNGTVRCTVDRWGGTGSASNQTNIVVLGCSLDILRQCYKLPSRLPDTISVVGSSQIDTDILAAAEGDDTEFDPAFDGVSMKSKKPTASISIPLKAPAKTWSDVDEDEERDLIDDHGNTLLDTPAAQFQHVSPPAYALSQFPAAADATADTVTFTNATVSNRVATDEHRRASRSGVRVSSTDGPASRRSSTIGASVEEKDPRPQEVVEPAEAEAERDGQDDDDEDEMPPQQTQRASSPDWPQSGDDSNGDTPLDVRGRQVTETEDEEPDETPQHESQDDETQHESQDDGVQLESEDELNASGKRVSKSSSSVSVSKRRRIDAPAASRSTRSTVSPVKDKKQSKKLVQTKIPLKKAKASTPEPILIKGYPLELPASVFEEIGHSHAEVSKAIYTAILCAYPTTGDRAVLLPRRNKPFQVLSKLLQAWTPGAWSLAPLAGTIRLAFSPADVPEPVLKGLKKLNASAAKATKR